MTVVVFAMVRRLGSIRSRAEKMIAKLTLGAGQSYRDQVTDALIRQMVRRRHQ